MAKKFKGRHLQILLALADEPRNGLEIMREVLETTEGRMTLWPGALYGSLRELSKLGWVQEVPHESQVVRGGSPRYYRITGRGAEALREELGHLAGVLAVARRKKILGLEN